MDTRPLRRRRKRESGRGGQESLKRTYAQQSKMTTPEVPTQQSTASQCLSAKGLPTKGNNRYMEKAMGEIPTLCKS